MPDYVCPECGKPLMQRAVVIEGTMMHYECHLKLKAKARMDIERRVDAVRAWTRTRNGDRS